MSQELFFGITSISIALAAAIITIWQGFLTRKHNRLSVKPILRIDTQFLLGKQCKILLVNNGIGPAIIKSVKYFIDDDSSEQTIMDVWEKEYIKEGSPR